MEPKILTVGAAYMDVLFSTPAIPASGETVTVEDVSAVWLADGQGVNCAVALARLGAGSTLSCRLGQDVQGQRLYTVLTEAGIDTSAIIADARAATGLRLLLSDGGAVRTVCYPAANRNLTRDNLDAAFASRLDAICLHMDLSEEIILEAAARGAEKHLPLFLNLSPVVPSFPYGKLPQMDIVCLGDAEIEAMTGIRPNGSDAALRALLSLSKTVASRFYAVHMGDRGTFLFDGRHFSMVSPVPVKALDNAAASEAYFAALSLEYLRTRGNLTAAAKYAGAVAALTVARAGTLASLPTQAEVDAFVRSNRIR